MIFAANDYAEGGWEQAAKNVVVPGDLIESVAKEADDMFQQWLKKGTQNRHRAIFRGLEDMPEYQGFQE